MDCRQAKSSLADLSADDLPPDFCAALRAHLEKCPPCRQEWEEFTRTLFSLSSTAQPVPTAHQSRAMWEGCLHELMERVERQRLEASRPAWWRWASRQPRLGWATLGGALAVLGGVWLLTPAPSIDSASSSVAPIAARPVSSTRFNPGHEAPGRFVAFATPPAAASSLINHHAAMAFDPFADHVGSTLVSYSATAAAH